MIKELFSVCYDYASAYFHQGCVYRWSSQPKLCHAKGAGNILIVAAAEFSHISFTKLNKFSCLLNLRIPQKIMFYEHRKQFVFPEIDAAWRKNQVQRIEEIVPGHSATYNTVSAIDAETNKVINVRVVHVKV